LATKSEVIQVLRYKENDDLEHRISEVDDLVERWRRRVARVPSRLRNEFRERLLISLIYHDAALEGDVLTYSEIKTALDPGASPVEGVPTASHESIRRYYAACVFVEQMSVPDAPPFDRAMLDRLYGILAPEEQATGTQYRIENPLHRLYYHDIVAPERIASAMDQLGDWLTSEEGRTLHPIERATEAHLRLMTIFPWAKDSGRGARILSNMILRRAEYPLAVLHSIDRQGYYEALRGDRETLITLYLEAIETTALSEIKVYDEAERASRRAS
jgi:Fic family protein